MHEHYLARCEIGDHDRHNSCRANNKSELRPRRYSRIAQRYFIIVAATSVSDIVAYVASCVRMFVHKAFARMSGLKPVQLLLLILACGTGMTIAGLWAALTRTRDTTV